jgi:hypothetical protein
MHTLHFNQINPSITLSLLPCSFIIQQSSVHFVIPSSCIRGSFKVFCLAVKTVIQNKNTFFFRYIKENFKKNFL